jgi:hypothetical protein
MVPHIFVRAFSVELMAYCGHIYPNNYYSLALFNAFYSFGATLENLDMIFSDGSTYFSCLFHRNIKFYYRSLQRSYLRPLSEHGYNSLRKWVKTGWWCHIRLVYCCGGNIICYSHAQYWHRSTAAPVLFITAKREIKTLLCFLIPICHAVRQGSNGCSQLLLFLLRTDSVEEWNRILPAKLLVTWLVEIMRAYNWIRIFRTVFTRALPWTLTQEILN